MLLGWVMFSLVPVCLAVSSGNTGMCNPAGNMGCTGWEIKEDGTENRLSCTQDAGSMSWARRAERTDMYTIRAGDGAPGDDVASYTPGEYVSIFARAVVYKQRYRGLLLVAHNSAGEQVGSFEFAKESDSPAYWVPPNCGAGAVIHKNADPKPYGYEFRWKAPATDVGSVIFKALFKSGPANTGEFWWPNGGAGDLVLTARTNPPPVIWFKGTAGQTCDQVCTANGRAGVDTALLASTDSAAEFRAALARTELCRAPYVSTCASNAPSKETSTDWCSFSSPTCSSQSWRSTGAGGGRVPLCACSPDATPASDCPAENGWQSTTPGATATKQCPTGQQGENTRECDVSGSWTLEVNTCAATPTCSDGVQNQGEEAPDCGGPCSACSQCAGINCGAYGSCQEATGTCFCTDDYTGDRCEIPPADPCAGINCGTYGSCSTGTCTCTNGYGGTLCDTPPAPTCADGISNQNEVGVDCGGPCAACPDFEWQESMWGQCSKTCGGGIRSRSVTCWDNNAQEASPGSCDGLHAPITEEDCNPDACPTYSWTAAAWNPCSTMCGGGTQDRPVQCISSIGNAVVTEPGLCAESAKPAETQACNPQTCVSPRWVAQSWDACSLDCGGGTQARVVQCVHPDGTVLADGDCTAPTDPKPAADQACNTHECKSYSWYFCPQWSPCTATCGGGTGMLGYQFRSVFCQDAEGKLADYSLCDSETEPASGASVCNTEKCTDYNWMADGDWSACVDGKRMRTFHCHDKDGTSASNDDCDAHAGRKPIGELPCTPGIIECIFSEEELEEETPRMSSASLSAPTFTSLAFLISSLSLGGRSSYMMALVGVLALAGSADGHNWLHTPGRASRQASTVAPCQGRKASDLHAQVGPDQPFTIKFATGHKGYPSYWVAVAGSDAHWLAHPDFQAMVDDYISQGTSDHLSADNRRYHGFDYDGDVTPYNDRSDPIGEQFSGSHDENFLTHDRAPTVNLWRYTDAALATDKRVEYASAQYPWIVAAMRYSHLYHLPSDYDAFQMRIPARVGDGHYIVHWRWSGYYDCVDVDRKSTATTDPDGKLQPGVFVYNQVDHCQYESPITIETRCMEVVKDVHTCIQSLPGWKDTNRLGVQVVPFRNPASVHQSFAQEIAIPWDDGTCAGSTWTRLTGQVTESAKNWGEWDSRTTTADGKCTVSSGLTSTLAVAVAQCVGVRQFCVGLSYEDDGSDIHVGVHEFRVCETTTLEACTNCKSLFPIAQTPATYSSPTATRVNFTPLRHLDQTPAGQIGDAGEPFAVQSNGESYGWNCAESTNCRWCCDETWSGCVGAYGAGCCAGNPDDTYAYAVNDKCANEPTKSKLWNIVVPNGIYEVRSYHKSSDTDVGNGGCNVEGARLNAEIRSGEVPSPHTTGWVKVEVRDGQLTLNGDGGVDEGCWQLNWLEYRKVAELDIWVQDWMPLPLDNPTWDMELSSAEPVGIVSIHNFEFWERNAGVDVTNCASWWLFKGHRCYDSRPMGWFNAADEGAIVGVGNGPCTGGTCPGTECGRINLATGDYTDRFDIDCKGAVGTHVWVKLPGANRQLAHVIRPNRIEPKVDTANGDIPFVCYGVEARPTTTTSPEFIISLDPDDPIFYSTCYVREEAIEWLQVAAAPNPDRWRFNGRCVDCQTFHQNKAVNKGTPTELPLSWLMVDGQCVDCDAEVPPPLEELTWFPVATGRCLSPHANNFDWGVPGCPADVSCEKALYARGRTREDGYWISSVLFNECKALALADPDCSSSLSYHLHTDGYGSCVCYHKHECCGECASATWEATLALDSRTHVFDHAHDPVPDPTCSRGFLGENDIICCAAGTCEGVCGKDWSCLASGANGGQCCAETVTISCAEAGPPCIV